jgi:general stress protein 26
MRADDPAVVDVMRRSMVARIATLSRNGRPHVSPLYSVHLDGRVWLGTVDWTLAARNVGADSRVSVLFEVEPDPGDRRVLRIGGRARVRTDRRTQRSYNRRVARKYLLTPGGIRNALAHVRQLPLVRNYRAQGAEKGQPCVIEVIPEQAEFLDDQRA